MGTRPSLFLTATTVLAVALSLTSAPAWRKRANPPLARACLEPPTEAEPDAFGAGARRLICRITPRGSANQPVKAPSSATTSHVPRAAAAGTRTFEPPDRRSICRASRPRAAHHVPEFSFQIFRRHAIAMAFEWSHVHCMIYTDGSVHPEDLNSDGHRATGTGHPVVEVANHNDKMCWTRPGISHRCLARRREASASIATRSSMRPRS